MKKNKFMKLASGLLVLCLMTTCVIGATLAKYTTGSSASDTARVAKWGVRVSAATDPTFKTEYDTTDAEYAGVSVQSSDSKKVVAPGTNGTASGFSVSGTPEVAVRVAFVVENVSDVVLKAGTYKYVDTGAEHTVAEYKPVKFTLTQTKSGSPATKLVNNGTLADVETALEDLSEDYAPNTNLAEKIGTLELSWTWAFDDAENIGVNDKADTLLGDIAASNTSVVKVEGEGNAAIEEGTDKDYNLTVSYKVTITVTQID